MKYCRSAKKVIYLGVWMESMLMAMTKACPGPFLSQSMEETDLDLGLYVTLAGLPVQITLSTH